MKLLFRRELRESKDVPLEFEDLIIGLKCLSEIDQIRKTEKGLSKWVKVFLTKKKYVNQIVKNKLGEDKNE